MRNRHATPLIAAVLTLIGLCTAVSALAQEPPPPPPAANENPPAPQPDQAPPPPPAQPPADPAPAPPPAAEAPDRPAGDAAPKQLDCPPPPDAAPRQGEQKPPMPCMGDRPRCTCPDCPMAKGIGPIGPGPQGRGGRKFDRRGAPDAFPGGPKDARPGDDFRGPERRGPRGFQRGFEDREGPPPPNFRGHGPMDPVQLFKAIDANGDGVIARDEFMEFHARMRPTEPPDQFRGEPRTMGRGPEGREGPPPRPHGARPGDDRCGPDGPDRRGPEGLDRGGPPWNDRPTELPR